MTKAAVATWRVSWGGVRAGALAGPGVLLLLVIVGVGVGSAPPAAAAQLPMPITIAGEMLWVSGDKMMVSTRGGPVAVDLTDIRLNSTWR